jgi:hypothetical protein
MFGLMTLWFGPFVEIRPESGYFHLCPACYRDRIEPHLEQVQGRLLELHPLARHLGLHLDPPADPDLGEDRKDPAAPASPVAPPRGRARVAAGAVGPAGAEPRPRRTSTRP